MSPTRIQLATGLRRLRPRVPQAGTATLQLQQPAGACPKCEGFGNLIDLDMDLIVPDPKKTIQDGAIAPWNTPAYAHELQELLALASDYGLPVDVPYRDLTDAQRRLIREGVPEREFGGLEGFFAWLERRKYKMHLRVFLSRWRSSRPCDECRGARLRPEALAIRLGGLNIAEVSQLKICDALEFVRQLPLTDRQRVWSYDAGTSSVAATLSDDGRRRLPDVGPPPQNTQWR